MAANTPHVSASNGNENSAKLPTDKQFLDTFWKLAVPSDNERISGATTLLQILIKKQGETKAEDQYCSEVSYSLRRLVRGLASSRKGARQGYAIALTELLCKVKEIALEDVFKLIKQELLVSGKKSEEKEYAFGQVFAYLAVIQSGRLNKHNGPSSVHILEQLHALSKQKSYLQLICLQGVIDLIKRSSSELFTDHIWPVLKSDLKQGWEEISPNNLALLMVSRQKFPDVVKSKFLQNHFGHADLVHPSNFTHIIKILTKSTVISHPIVHPVCDMLLALVFQDSSRVAQFWKIVVDDGLCTSKHETKYLAFSLLERAAPLCEAKQLRALFSEKLIRSMINNLANKQAILHSAAVKLSENLADAVKNIREPLVQFTVAKCLLSRPGHVKFDDITKSKTVYSIISNFNCGAVKLYLKWLKKLFHSGTASISHRMQEPNLDEDRKWICMQVLTLIKNPKLPREEDWLLDATRFLFLHAFFTVDKPEPGIPECSSVLETPVSADLQKMIGSQFYGALGVLSTASLRPSAQETETETETETEERSSSPESRHMGTTSSGELWVSLLGHYAQDLLTCENVSCNVEFTGKTQDAWSAMMESIGSIQEKSSNSSAMSSGLAFQLLFLHVGLQMFSEPKQSADILQDLQSCYKRAQQRRRSTKKDKDEPEWVEVIVEILLSLLSKPSHLLRTVVDLAFKMICPHMTQPALQQLLDVLDPAKSNVQVGQESDEEGEEEEEEDDEEEDDEEEDDEEEDESNNFTKLKTQKPLTNGHKKNTNADSDDSEEEDDDEDDDGEDEDEDDDDEDDEEGDEDPAMKEQIKAALGNAAVDSEAEDSGTDFELDDDAMIAHDDALSQAFKAMASRSRKSKKEASTIMLHFKLRVLDLLDIFIKRQQNNPLILDLVVPLLKVIESSAGHKDNQLLAEKALNIYRNKLCRVKKYPHNLSEHKEDIHDTIEELIQIAKKAHSMTIVSLVSSGCLFLMRVLRGNVANTDPSPLKTRGQRAKGSEKKKGKKKGGKEEEEEKKEETESAMGLVDVGRITGLYADALEDFTMHRATCLHPNLFTDLIDRFPALAWHLSDTLTSAAQNGVQLYRRTQACRMLTLLLSKRPYAATLSSWPKVSKHILSAAMLILQGMVGEGSQFKAKSAIQLLHAVQQCAALGHHLNKLPDFGEISAVLETLKERPEVKRSGEFRSALDTAIAAIENKSKSSKKGKKKRKKSRKRRRSLSTSST